MPEKAPEALVSEDEADEQKKRLALERYIPMMSRGFNSLLAAVTFFLILRLWGIDWPFGREITSAGLGILITLLLGYVTWEFAKSVIDRKIREEMPDDEAETDEGGSGGSRSGTLLLLFRKFILSALVVVAVMIILSAIGVNIGPLIAGAGVLGLAIGFGAQTLVRDIISGLFFLIDDAFRIGDYVDTGKVRGTVEHISLRSLRLRHHRGMIHTIPFGELGQVTNFSRDYIIEKLSFRVRYDTDIDAVRKIIKKINKEISRNAELGPSLLDKIKSQGVRALEDSAMIMRVKFKSVPGEQFVIRREVYRLMQEKFREAGIEFANRNVTVYLPPDQTPDNTRLSEAGAAAGVTVQAEAEQALKQKKEARPAR
ncbi:mechanosensitive ion channel family protein [Desulfonema ishimotonii]|uniref:Mechanosensitive ion channel family protein n=1 Tax=Desulfonema ishimotonii TaxID=45657 RepID=A0A401G3C7_9BACT|nr:mechanosensitive ion channel family protein [Desulfonema ishimotonii]GBC63724.1 mechanosensitive ion channel family protein [Desulfonema ishimotonii]